jgi:polyisoprenoid-binding protein YceI
MTRSIRVRAAHPGRIGADFFDVANLPTITFTSKKVERVGEGRLKLVGDLTIHGVTKEVTLDLEEPTLR